MAKICWRIVAAIKRSWERREKYGTDEQNLVRLASAFDLPTAEIKAIVNYKEKDHGKTK